MVQSLTALIFNVVIVLTCLLVVYHYESVLKSIVIVDNHHSEKIRSSPGHDLNYSKVLRQTICSNKTTVALLQRYQWIAALRELSTDFSLNTTNLDEMGFYDELYGALQMRIDLKTRNQWNQNSKVNSVIYYRIFKCGNDNIRTMLFESAYTMSNHTVMRVDCPAELCAHENVVRLTPGEQRTLLNTRKTYHGRIALTFTRDPIARFISAINEIECRAKHFPERQMLLPVNETVGSIDRLKQWIRFILTDIAGSQVNLWKYQDIEASHFAPMVGTIVHGNIVEPGGLKLLRVEDFAFGWSNLSYMTGLPVFDALAKSKLQSNEWSKHKCSEDSMDIVKNYTKFFQPEIDNSYQKINSNLDKLRYLRAFCRLYITDYICAVPVKCDDILQEILFFIS